MDPTYLITPFLAWLVAGSTKFIISSVCARRLAFDRIGYGGMPSNHSAIVSAMTVLIGLNEGIASPAFGVALTLAFIVVMDAVSLRRQIGRHAAAINRLSEPAEGEAMLRERMGHSRAEVAAGIAVGSLTALAIYSVRILIG